MCFVEQKNGSMSSDTHTTNISASRPERLDWSLQRLIRTIRLADHNNLEVVADRAAESEAKGTDGLPLEDSQLWEQDAMIAISLEIFFPGALKGVQRTDKVYAGDNAPPCIFNAPRDDHSLGATMSTCCILSLCKLGGCFKLALDC